MNLFTIDHGPDNYEEYVDLDRIIFIRCYAKFNAENKHHTDYQRLKKILSVANPDFDYVVDLIFDGGAKEQIKLNAFGWEDFYNALINKNDTL